tara:strand:- start:18 stop:875 length:858 start_codon:yes stop_codon:yes gene_type:complete
MPIPKRDKGEEAKKFMSRCMSSDTMNDEYPDSDQRTAVCISQSRAGADKNNMGKLVIEELVYADYEAECDCGNTEELSEANFVVPEEADYYEGYEDEVEEVSADGLWDNIRKKKEREGKKYKPAKPGDPDRPDPESWKKAQSHDPGSMEKYVFTSKEAAEKKAKEIGLKGAHEHKSGDGATVWMPGAKMKDFQDWYNKHKEASQAAKYQGRTVKLNKPFKTPGGPKKSSVYVKNEKGNVVKVNFGDPNMKIKKSDPARRRSFRARHKCDTPGPKWKARYWSCKAW